MDVQGTALKLTRYAAKGDTGKSAESVQLIEGRGMEGDFRAGGERQVSLLAAEVRQWMDGQNEGGLCFGRYKENVLFSGIPPQVLRPGAVFLLGGAALEISAEKKHCFSECPLASQKKACLLAGQKVFAKVVRTGIVHKGDAISLFDRKEFL